MGARTQKDLNWTRSELRERVGGDARGFRGEKKGGGRTGEI